MDSQWTKSFIRKPPSNRPEQPSHIGRQRASTRVGKRKRSPKSRNSYRKLEARENSQLSSPSGSLDNEPKHLYPQASVRPSGPNLKRKQIQEPEQYAGAEDLDHSYSQKQEPPVPKRRQVSIANTIDEGAVPTSTSHNNKDSNIDLIQFWVDNDCSGGNFQEDSDMSQPLNRKRSVRSLCKHGSDTSSISLGQGKASAVRSGRYQKILESADIYIGQPEPNSRAVSQDQAFCYKLLPTD